MKKYLIVLLLPFLIQCTGNEEKLRTELDSLRTINQQRDETINEFVESFNEIEENLQTIKQKESIIRVNSSDTEMEQNAKERINEDILTIYELMRENKKELKEARQKLRNSGMKIKGLQDMIANMEKQLQTKDNEIRQLKQKLANLNILVGEMSEDIDRMEGEIDSLSTESEEKTEVIEEQTEELNTAYYVFGTDKELREQGVITKEGGFIGIGRTEKLRKDFNKDYFTEIDIREVKEIPIMAKKAEIVTTHPAGSFTLVGEKPVKKLVIKNPEQFWSVSKYLVIVVKN